MMMGKVIAAEGNAILRRREVERLTGLSRSTIYRLMEAGSFPRQHKLSVGAVGWMQAEISNWIESRPPVHT